MRDTVDFGIDLGTTNSAIAVVDDDEVSVIKNNDGWDYTPSAVWMPKAGVVYVGRQARERSEKDPDNAIAEFKLEMGLADAGRWFVDCEVELTPVQLSAEVLKSLRADAVHQYGEPPEVAVITVPAAFGLHQNNATSEAAKLAGFTGACPLVQEPTAAAFAYGFRDESETAYWMVFDFGGGTFDAAIVSKRDGELTVLNHAGDPYLGGKRIDWAIVERLLAPAAARDLGLAEFTRGNPQWRKNFATLKIAAENAKIHLSRRDTADITVELFRAKGTSDTFEYTLRRDDVDRLAERFYASAIKLCRDALTEGNLQPDDIDRLLLVGGVTLAPGLRERLADPREGLGIALDYSQDPTTVVARGAAIFASGVSIPRVLEPPKPGAFTARYVHQAIVTTTTPTVAGELFSGSPVDWTKYHVTISNPTGNPPFRGTRIALSREGTFVTEVSVVEHAKSQFLVELTDASGARQRLTPDTFPITHRDTEFAGAVLTHSVGIGRADGTFAPLVTKGASLPAVRSATFQTTVPLLRSDADSAIEVPVVEGEWGRAERNLLVGMLAIRPKNTRIDLPAGTEVEVTVDIDESRLVTVIADVPLVEQQFEAEIDLNSVQSPDPADLRKQLALVERRFERVKGSVDAAGSATARGLVAEITKTDVLDNVSELVRTAEVDDGSAATAGQRIRDLEAKLDEVERAGQLPGLIRELREALDECREHVTVSDDEDDRTALAQLQRRAEAAIADEDEKTIVSLLGQAHTLINSFLRRRDDWEVQLFYGFVAFRDDLMPPAKVASLIREGEQAIAAGDKQALSGVCERLRRCIPAGSKLPGLEDKEWR